jgi:hypothetical protein
MQPSALHFVFGCVGVGLEVENWLSRKRVGGGGGPPLLHSGHPVMGSQAT